MSNDIICMCEYFGFYVQACISKLSISKSRPAIDAFNAYRSSRSKFVTVCSKFCRTHDYHNMNMLSTLLSVCEGPVTGEFTPWRAKRAMIFPHSNSGHAVKKVFTNISFTCLMHTHTSHVLKHRLSIWNGVENMITVITGAVGIKPQWNKTKKPFAYHVRYLSMPNVNPSGFFSFCVFTYNHTYVCVVDVH